ncbi:MAG: M14 family zinc carboxypeptidase [Thermoanaerobaculia bacterium]
MKRIIVLILLFAATTSLAVAASPTPKQFLGYQIGDHFTPWSRIADYFDTLAQTSDRVTVQRFGETWERRPLMYAVITSSRNQARIEEIRKNLAAIADPRATTPAEAQRIASSTPVVVWLAFGVHGDESSSSEAAMEVANWLVQGGKEADDLLENTVVIIDPLENPDGRERYVQWFRQTVGQKADPNPSSFQHLQPWPGGRYNHYLVDMNRDWAWSTQRETRARISAFRQWHPQVFVDFHEMGVDSSYFFPPDASPINSNIRQDTEKWLQVFGRANADVFSSRGWPFFVNEVFDLFYPGYGDSWPSLNGAIGMTYEMAGGGRAGRKVRRDDGTILTLAERAEKHATAAMNTIRTAATHRHDLILHTFDTFESNLEAPASTYFIAPGSPNFDDAVDLLRRQGIEIRMLTQPLTVNATAIRTGESGTRQIPAGSAVISTRQPLGALARSLLERSPVFSDHFIERQRERIARDQPDEFYDITAWSIPVSHALDAWVSQKPLNAPTTPWADQEKPQFQKAKFAWLIDGADPAVYRTAGQLLERGIRFSVSSTDLELGSEKLARGTLAILRSNNGDDLDKSLKEIVDATAAHTIPLDNAWTDGVVLGSEKFQYVRDPGIALVGGEGTDSSAFGALWYTIDVEVPVPHSVIPLDRLGSTDLSKIHVLLLPDGRGYSRLLDKGAIERLQQWVRDGGTIVATANAGKFLRSKEAGLSSIEEWAPPKKDEKEAKSEGRPLGERYNDYQVPGAAFRTEMNPSSYLTFGLTSAPDVFVSGKTALLPLPHPVDNVLRIRSDDPLAAGFAWPESIDRLKGSVWLGIEHTGKGKVITFADEPNFRLFWRATLAPLMNALLYSHSF